MSRAKAAVFLAVALVLAACGISYGIEPARFVFASSGHLSQHAVLSAVGDLLEPQGFEDLGTDQEMIAHLRRRQPETDWVVAELQNRFTYVSQKDDIRVVVTDYSDRSRERSFAFDAPQGPFFEIAIYEERPGGFSPRGHAFVSTLRNELERALKTFVRMVTPPAATDEVAFWRISIINGLTLALYWVMAFTAAIVVTGAMTRYVLNQWSASRPTKRVIFTIVNTWLATPLPFPAATILVILLPNIFASPWIYGDYYHRVLDAAVWSFPISIVLCFVISLRAFPERGADKG